MPASSKAAASVLPVSILWGRSARRLAEKIASDLPNSRIGLLVKATPGMNSSSNWVTGELIFEGLCATDQPEDQSPSNIARQLRRIAEKGSLDHLLIECSDHAPLMALSSLFFRHQSEAKDGQDDVTRLASVIATIDSVCFLDQLVTARGADLQNSPCLTAEQVEFADVIVLEGEPSSSDYNRARVLVMTLNPRARVIAIEEATSAEALGVERSFDFAAAIEKPGWRKLLDADPADRGEAKHASTFAYRARRPFHPTRFWQLIHSPLPGVVRAKGFFWLATQMNIVGGLNLAGSECQFGQTGTWPAASSDEPKEADPPGQIERDWAKSFGDRRQSIAFIGLDCDPVSLTAQLEACLLTEVEISAGELSWAALPDPFPQWSQGMHNHHCEAEDCCHH